MTGARDSDGPTVSVVVPTYERPRLVVDAVESVLGQTHGALQCIVVDSASTTPASRALCGVDDERLTVVELDADRGLQHARNVGISVSSGEFLAFLDDDDVWLPRKLERQLAFVADAGLDGCATLKRVVDEDGEWVPETGYMSRYRALMGDLRTQPMSTLVVRRGPVEAVGGFDESFPFQHEDREFCVRLLGEAVVGVLERPLVEVGREDRADFPDPAALAEGKRALFEKHADVVDSLSRLERARVRAYNRLELALAACYHGERRRSLGLFARSLAPPVLSPTQYGFYLSVLWESLPPTD